MAEYEKIVELDSEIKVINKFLSELCFVFNVVVYLIKEKRISSKTYLEIV